MNEAINNRHKWQKANDVGFIQKCLYLGILFSAITQTFLANFDEILQGTWRDYYVNVTIKGAGGGVDDPGKVEIEFTIVPDRGECQLPDTFYQIKKYCS